MTKQEIEDKKSCFLNCCQDAISNLCYYDRKDCEVVSVDDVEFLLNNGHVTIDEMFERMKTEIIKNFPKVNYNGKP